MEAERPADHEPIFRLAAPSAADLAAFEQDGYVAFRGHAPDDNFDRSR